MSIQNCGIAEMFQAVVEIIQILEVAMVLKLSY